MTDAGLAGENAGPHAGEDGRENGLEIIVAPVPIGDLITEIGHIEGELQKIGGQRSDALTREYDFTFKAELVKRLNTAQQRVDEKIASMHHAASKETLWGTPSGERCPLCGRSA